MFKRVEQTLASGLTLRGWCTEKRGLPVIAFLHGNGFSSGTYFPMHRILSRHFDLVMLDIPGHGCSDPVNPHAGWNQTADYMHEGLQKLSAGFGQPVYGVGHSLGGVLTVLSAHKHPEAYRKLVLLDPVLFPRSMLLTMRLVSWLGLTSRVHPFVRSTLRRRSNWSSRAEAFDYLHGRKIYRGWTDDALHSFIDHALKEDAEGGVELSCAPQLEAHYFSTLPDGLWKSLNSLSCDVRIHMGETSYPFALKAARTADCENEQVQFSTLQGSHCFMQEFPHLAAAQIVSALADDES